MDAFSLPRTPDGRWFSRARDHDARRARVIATLRHAVSPVDGRRGPGALPVSLPVILEQWPYGFLFGAAGLHLAPQCFLGDGWPHDGDTLRAAAPSLWGGDA